MSSIILAIAAKVGRPLVTDNLTDLLRNMRYARVQVEFDSSKPSSKHGVLVKGKKGIFLQPFVYENLPSSCYHYGWLGHFDDGCCFLHVNPPSDTSDYPLQPENFVS